jgi:hypothetical protein
MLVGQAGVGKDTAGTAIAEHFTGDCIALADPMKQFAKKIFHFTDVQLWGPSEARNAVDSRPKDQSHWYDLVRDNFDYAARDWVEQILPEHLHDSGERALRKWFHDGVLHDLYLGEIQLTPRYILQTLGTEWGRTVYPRVWVDHGIRTATRLLEGGVRYERNSGLLVTPKYYSNLVVITDGRFRNEVIHAKDRGALVVQIIRPDAGGATGGVSGHRSETEQKTLPPHFFDVIVVNDGPIEYFKATVVDLVHQLTKPHQYVVV